MGDLKQIVYEEMSKYAIKDWNDEAYLKVSDDQKTYIVVSVDEDKEQRFVDIDILVWFMDDKIVIEQDMNNKPLVDALVRAGEKLPA
ncbi:MAG: XisI protein [Anaerolineae bacterium]|nr:XisI protein [Anaerolineae bacterium]